jgi:hypothetical protein
MDISLYVQYFMLQTLKITAKIRKQRWVGLTPGINHIKILWAYLCTELSQVNEVMHLNMRLKVL